MTGRRLSAAAILAAALIALLPPAAQAHPALLETAPSGGLIAPKPPTQVQLSFSEAAVASGSRISVSHLAGAKVPVGPLQSANGGRTLSVTPDSRLRSGVYEVTWSALGDDGHLVGGKFAFGVAGAHGQSPPGAQALVAFGQRGGGVSENAAFENGISLFARWLGLLGASVLAGGFLLVRRLRTAVDGGAEIAPRRWRAASRLAWVVVAMAALEGAIAAATAGADGSFNLTAVTSSPTGRGILVELGLIAVLSGLLLAWRHRDERRDVVLALGGLAVLVTQGVTGHVQSLGTGVALAAFAQTLHVVSAGVWLGGILTLAAVCVRGRGGPGLPLGASARAFAPLAAASLGVAAVTGVLAALREVDDIYFLRWSAYGRVVLIKTALVAVAAAIGAVAFLRSRRNEASPALLRGEAVAVVAVLALATVLSGLAPGRGQALPAERGTLLPGPAVATAVGPSGPLGVTLAPARAGDNTLSVVEGSQASSDVAPKPLADVRATFYCTCSKQQVQAKLHRGAGGTWTAGVDLPTDGSWYARLRAGKANASPVALPVGVPQAAGPGVVEVLSVGDFSEADADRCRSHVLGLELAVGRLNASGGLDDGRKVAVLGVDDGGSEAKARQAVDDAMAADDPVALAAPCGPAAAAAVKEAGARGLPSIVGDPSVAPVETPLDFRLAADPYAEGYAEAQYLKTNVESSANSKVVRIIDTGDVEARRRIAGVRAALASSDLRVVTEPPSALAGGRAALRRLVDNRNSIAVLVDGNDPERVAHELAALGQTGLDFAPAVIMPAERILSEDLVMESGAVGRIGAIIGASEVTPDSAGSLTYAQTVPALYPGEQPSLDGLRGYLAGLALDQGLDGGTSRSALASRLRTPAPFSDALLSPWRSDAPTLGSQRLNLVQGNFLPATLIPTSKGGESYNGSYFTDGSWSRPTTQIFGPPLDRPVPPLR